MFLLFDEHGFLAANLLCFVGWAQFKKDDLRHEERLPNSWGCRLCFKETASSSSHNSSAIIAKTMGSKSSSFVVNVMVGDRAGRETPS